MNLKNFVGMLDLKTLFTVTLSVISAIFLIVIGSGKIVQAIISHNPLFDSSISSNNYHLFKFYL
jgi:hypothetical protein